MKNGMFSLMVVFTSAICHLTSSIHVLGQDSSPVNAEAIEDKLENLPLLFRQNMGQWDEKILFSGASHSANVYFLKNELSFGFTRTIKTENEDTGPVLAAGRSASELRAFAERKFYNKRKTPDVEYLVWNVRFEGANPNAVVSARGKADSRTNYFMGNDPRKHCVNVPDYKVITYQNIYENIDLKYYGSNNRLKYDFVLKANARVADIKMTYAGIKKMSINREGDLLLSTAWGEMKEDKPFTYQLVNGKRTKIESAYVLLNDSTVGFKMLQEYDRSQELIIDPIVLDWATFVGGTYSVKYGLTGQISKVAVDAGGNVYAVGSYATTFPTTPGSYDPTFGGGTGYDVIVFKMNATGTALIYSTYMGGNQWDSGSNLYLEATGEVYITGQTSSGTWPTLNAYDNSYNGGGDIFVTKLNAAGNALLHSTFLGGSGSDNGADITLDAGGNIYVAGNTSSVNFPTSAGAFQTTLKGSSDITVSKLSPTGNTLLYSTLIGSSKNETGVGIGVNAAGEATVGGNSDSTDFPTTAGAYDQTMNDAPNIYNLKGDMVVFKLNPTATGLIFSTYLGGNIGDAMQGMHVSPADEAFVCGVILFSNNFPITPGVIGPTTANGTFDSFVTRFNSTGTALIYSTYLGNADPSSDEARDIWVNASSEAYVTGDGGSYSTFPVTTGLCVTCTGGEDIYACKLNATASCYMWSTFIGSKDWDVCQAIGVYVGAAQEDIALGFGSNSFVFPTTAGVFQQNKPTTDSSNTIPGIVKYIATPGGSANAGPDVTICPGATVTLSGGAGSSSYLWSPGGQTTSSIAVSPSVTTSYTLSVGTTCGAGTDSVKVTVINSLAAAISGNTSLCTGQNATLTATGGGSYSWSTGATAAVITVTPTSSSTYSVIVTSGSCPADTATIALTVSAPPNTTVTGNSAVCPGLVTTLTASGGGTYSWNTGGTDSFITVIPTANTTYTVTVTNSSGCSVTATHFMVIKPAVNAGTASTPAGCGVSNGTATANPTAGSPPFSFSWSNGQSAQTASGLAAGTYSVTITDLGGCTKTFTVLVSSGSSLTVTATSTQTGCSASNGTATANPSSGTAPYTYSWSNGQTTSVAVALAGGSYTVIITDASGCTITATANVTTAPGPSATAAATATTITLGGNTSLSSTGGVTYQWAPTTGLSCTTCSNPIATPDQTTEYCVIVKDAGGCSDSACVTVVVDIPCGNIYIPNAFSPNDDLENDLECVFGPCIDALHLIIYNRWGEMVFESHDQKICWDGSYKGKPLDSGVFSYYLEATMQNGEKVIRRGNVSLVR